MCVSHTSFSCQRVVFNEKIIKILQNFFFKNKKKKKCIELDEMHRRLLMFRTTR